MKNWICSDCNKTFGELTGEDGLIAHKETVHGQKQKLEALREYDTQKINYQVKNAKQN